MTFYILMKGDTEKDAINSTNTLGEISFNTFHSEDGFKILMNIKRHIIWIHEGKGPQCGLCD